MNQAENYINTVSAIDHMLPPVIDVEPYGDFKALKDIPDAVTEIKVWLHTIEIEYGMRPVIYTTEEFYRDCISTEFADYDIWIRSVYKRPSKSIAWTFWQYSNRMQLNGYNGSERFIDMNVFHGTAEEFFDYNN